MKLPTSTKPTSGFHICDILELNKDKKSTNDDESKAVEDKSKTDDDDDEMELKRENLSCESEENLTAKSSNLSPSPSSPNLARESKSSIESPEDLIKYKKNLKRDDERPHLDASSGHHQLLSETLHQYPHLFQNHPAMRPWFNSNGKLNQIQNSLVKRCDGKIRFRFDKPFYQISRFN